ncbi:MAG: homoserine O-acetyltransferase, partial [Planctomycetaceae bacterium]|nr:homoserine O-acetyltransferase [Planctomycetaceae bacterium]
EEAHGPMAQCLGRGDIRYLLASYTTDWLFPTEQSRAIVRALLEARRDVTFIELDSPFGHDAFLIDSQLPKLRRLVEPFLATTLQQARR